MSQFRLQFRTIKWKSDAEKFIHLTFRLDWICRLKIVEVIHPKNSKKQN